MVWQGPLKVMNKGSSSNCNRTLIQGYQVFNYVLKMLAHKRYLYTIHGTLNVHGTFVLMLFKTTFFFNFQRTLKNAYQKHSHKVCKMKQNGTFPSCSLKVT